MLSYERFQTPAYRQTLGQIICIPASYAAAIAALCQVEETALREEADQEIRTALANGADWLKAVSGIGGYAVIEALHHFGPTQLISQIRTRLTVRRHLDLVDLAAQLRDGTAAAIVMLNFPKPPAHSVAVAFDSRIGFYVRDSDSPPGSPRRNPDAWYDESGPSLPAVLNKCCCGSAIGESMLFELKESHADPFILLTDE